VIRVPLPRLASRCVSLFLPRSPTPAPAPALPSSAAIIRPYLYPPLSLPATDYSLPTALRLSTLHA